MSGLAISLKPTKAEVKPFLQSREGANRMSD